jgi:DSF synthase
MPSVKLARRPDGTDLAAPPDTIELEFAVDERQLWPELRQIDCAFDISHAALWSFMDFDGSPSYNPAILEDFKRWQENIGQLKDTFGGNLKYVILGSRHPSVFCLGGHLPHFASRISARDRAGLVAYGRSCIEILHRNWRALDREVITIGLVQGDALGGGFESLLSFDVICAEKGAKFGFPERLFGLFPGMGALTFLGRKIGYAKAEQLITTGRLMSAEEAFELGLVHILAEPGGGVAAVNRYMEKGRARHSASFHFYQAAKRSNPIDFAELNDIVELWADAGLTLTTHDLQMMERLVKAQSKIATAPVRAPSPVRLSG